MFVKKTRNFWHEKIDNSKTYCRFKIMEKEMLLLLYGI